MIVEHMGHTFDFPDDLLYWKSSKDQFWIQKVSDERIRMGITSFAARISKSIETIKLKNVGGKAYQGRSIGTMESGKWLGPIRSPINGEIVAHNNSLLESPNRLNENPNETWILEIESGSIDEDLSAIDILTPNDEEFIIFIKQEIEGSEHFLS